MPKKLKTAISDSRLEMITKKTDKGRVYLFIKDASGSYHAFSEVQIKDTLRDFGVEAKQTNTRTAAKRFLGI